MSDFNDPLARNDIEDILSADLNEEQEVVEETTSLEEPVNEVMDLGVEKAKKHGYLTEDQYKAKHGSLDGFKSPDQFNKYGEAWGEVSDVIKGLQKKVEESNKATEALVNYNKRVEERAYQRARSELEAQLQEAINLGDVHSVQELTREKAKMEFQETHTRTQNLEQERINVENGFKERNKHWFGINHEMTQFAIAKDAEIRREAQENNIPLTYESLAKQVEAHLKAIYPDVMIAQARVTPTISASSSNVNRGTTGNPAVDSIDKVFNSLDEEHRIMYGAVKKVYEKTSGGKLYTKKDFLNQLKKDGEI